MVYISQQTDPNLAAAEMDLWASNSAMDVIHISYWVEENTFERDKEIKKVEDMILSLKRINL